MSDNENTALMTQLIAELRQSARDGEAIRLTLSRIEGRQQELSDDVDKLMHSVNGNGDPKKGIQFRVTKLEQWLGVFQWGGGLIASAVVGIGAFIVKDWWSGA